MDKIRSLETAAAAPDDPFPLFGEWLAAAEGAEPSDPNALCLATADADGQPNARMVLLKAWDARGFVFFTNRESRKGQELAANARAAMCFHWKTLGLQIRIQGKVTFVTEAESDAYYATRARGSRVGAWASQQSRPLESRSVFASRVKEYDEQFGATEDIPRPPHWGGYRLEPETIEFWHDGLHRLHARLLYNKAPDGWSRTMLYP